MALYYSQPSADIKMKYYKIKISFVIREELSVIRYDFSVWLRTVSNPADNNRL